MTTRDDKIFTLSTALQPLASTIDQFLEELVGERLGFVLVIGVDNTMQYVANVDRFVGAELLRELLSGWDNRRADIPGAINPDLKAPMHHYDVSFQHRNDGTKLHFVGLAAQSANLAEAQARSRLAVPDAWTCTSHPINPVVKE